MLAKLKTFSLVGIEALPVEVEVDVSPCGLPKQVLVGLARSGGQGEHASRRTGDGQLGLSAPAKPHRRQPGPGRSAQAGRFVRSADRAGHAGRQRAGRVGKAGRAMPSSASWPWTAPRGRPRGAVDGHGRRAPARSKNLRGLIVPTESAAEAAVVEGIEVIAVTSLAQAVGFLDRRDRNRADAARGWTNCSASFPPTTSISPTSAARKWPSGRSSSPPPADTIC